MRVRDLIQKLQKLDPDLQLLAVSEDEEIVEAGQPMRFLGVEDVSTMTGVTGRDLWGRMGIALGNAPDARTIATLNGVARIRAAREQGAVPRLPSDACPSSSLCSVTTSPGSAISSARPRANCSAAP